MSFRYSTPQQLRELTTPAETPAAGSRLLYVKSDGKLYFKNSAGVEAEADADKFTTGSTIVLPPGTSTTAKFARFNVPNDGTATSGWTDRLAFYFEDTTNSGTYTRAGYFNEYGELRARPAKVSTTAFRAMGITSGTNAIFQVAKTSSSDSYLEVGPNGGMYTLGQAAPTTGTTGMTVFYAKTDGLMYSKTDAGAETMMSASVEALPFSMSGTLVTRVGTNRFPIAGGTFTILSVAAMAGTAPTGASVIVDVNKNGTTIYGTQGNRPTIAISGTSATVGSASVTSVTTGDYLTVDVDQIGSTVAGADLTLVIRLQRTA